jgi:hypothetical protein
MPVFAYTSAISRILKSGTISKEDVEELLSSKNFQELLAVLYEKKLVTKEGLNAPGPVLTNLKETALLKLKGLSSMSKNSKFVADVVDAYVGLLAWTSWSPRYLTLSPSRGVTRRGRSPGRT